MTARIKTPTTKSQLSTTKVKPLIVVVGETASGKSSIAMKLAQKYNGEIISADSWSVYKGFDIGTAKPSLKEREQIPHHLIDVVEPQDGFNAVLYKLQANQVITDIFKRDKVPIIAGGTGLYIDAVLYDFKFLPTSKERAVLDKMTLQELHNLAKKRAIDTSNIDIRNKRRVVRAIESGGKPPAKSALRDNTLIIGIRREKDTLHKRITKRVEAMVQQGLEGEVQRLADTYGWSMEAMKGIGYWQWKDYFEGSQTLEETKTRIVQATKGLAKRQRTWFRKNKSIQWVAGYEQAENKVNSFLNK